MFVLPAPIIGTLDGFVLDSRRYEKLIASQNGNLDLATMRPYTMNEADIEHYESICPAYQGRIDMELARIMGLVRPPRAREATLNSLARDMTKYFQILYSNYALCRDNNFDYIDNGKQFFFPEKFCVSSTKGAVGSALLHGLDAYVAGSRKASHVYLIAPYLVDGVEVTLIADPTIDQFGKFRGRNTRNLVMLKTGRQWSYFKDVEMFPDTVMDFGQFHVALLNEHAPAYSIQEFYARVFDA